MAPCLKIGYSEVCARGSKFEFGGGVEDREPFVRIFQRFRAESNYAIPIPSEPPLPDTCFASTRWKDHTLFKRTVKLRSPERLEMIERLSRGRSYRIAHQLCLHKSRLESRSMR
eukprot:1903133-Pleurochrysis_carterae.AAC.2